MASRPLRARVAQVALLLWGALGIRDTFDAQDIALDEQQLGVQQLSGPPPTETTTTTSKPDPPGKKPNFLRVHAASFNAGNEKFVDSERFRDLLTQMSTGHESADIVVLGFQEFGDENFGFAEMARKNLWTQRSQAQSQAFARTLSEQGTPTEEALKAKEDTASYLSAADASASTAYELARVKEMMGPVVEWARTAKGEIKKAFDPYPNLKYTDSADMRIRSLINNLKHLEHVRKHVEARIQVMRSISIGGLVAPENMGTKPVVDDPRLQHDWDRLHEDLVALQRDLAGTLDDRLSWQGGVESELRDLAAEGEELSLGRADVVVQMHTATFNSASTATVNVFNCHNANHFDTNMYVFSNPWSNWGIKPVPWSSNQCVQPKEGSMGCNIDNNRGKVIVGTECGKVVNLLVLEATKEDNQVRICVMNTHMSFDGDSQMRMNYIEQALDETDKAGCEAVVFVGDFNTRLHCQAPDRKASRPANANPLEYVLELFKKPKGEGARLDGEHVFVDELAHMISNPEVTCFDKKVSGSWKLGNYNSTLYKRGIVESKVTFGPTYKMYPRAEAEGLKFHKCFAGMKMCYGNSDGADKHNPAWTDRVLAKGPVKAVGNYQSLEIPPGMKSDHLPVSATVWIDVHRKVHFNHLGKIPMKPPPKLFKGMNPTVTRSISAPVGSHDDT